MPRVCAPILAVLLLAATVAQAQETTDPAAAYWEKWITGNNALDIILPRRDEWTEKGLGIGGSYTTDLLGNPVGGKRQGFTYYGQLQLILAAELEKLVGWNDAYVVVSMFDSAGTNLSRNYIGNYFNVTEVASIPTVVLGQA